MNISPLRGMQTDIRAANSTRDLVRSMNAPDAYDRDQYNQIRTGRGGYNTDLYDQLQQGRQVNVRGIGPVKWTDQDITKFKRKQLGYNLTNEAKDFRENLGEFKTDRYRGLLSTYGDALDEGTKNTRENYSRRGLLYSGLEKRDQSSLRGELASQLAKSKVGINKEAEELARQKEQVAAAAELDNVQQLMQQAEQYYNISMENDLARRQNMASLAKGLGYGAGAYFGSQDSGQGLLDIQPNYSYSGFQSEPSYYGNLLGVNYGAG